MSLASAAPLPLQLATPSDTTTLAGRTPSHARVHPAALFSILDHHLRRPDSTEDDEAPESVIGTLLGTRIDGEVDVLSAFAVPHAVSPDQVSVEVEYHRSMLELHMRAHPGEQVVGWYATGSGATLTSNTALIHDFYNRETAPYDAVHITLDTDLQDANLGVKAWVSYVYPLLHVLRSNSLTLVPSSPLFGLNYKASSAAFSSVPLSLTYAASERPALNLLAKRTASPLSDLDVLAASLTDVQAQLRRVLSYVQAVVKGEQEGDPVVGRFILDSIAKVPVGQAYSSSASDEESQPTSTTQLEELFNSHLQDVLMVSYLANLVRGQAEISSRLTLLA